MNENPAANNAVSIYGQEGLDDFPVLKAFQQYIDAEQSKARKRMIMLCLFFGFLMTIVIVVFMIMLREADARNQLLLRDATAQNQALNDKLVEFAMKERERQPVVVQPQAPAHNQANDAAIKAMTDTLAALQKQMADQQAKMIEQQASSKRTAQRWLKSSSRPLRPQRQRPRKPPRLRRPLNPQGNSARFRDRSTKTLLNL